MIRIDAHHHVWDLSVRPQTWMAGDLYARIARSFTIEEFAPLAAAAGVGASVVVQTAGEPAETRELLALAEAHPLIAAVVGWVDLCAPDVTEQLGRLIAGPGGTWLRGIRHQAHDEADPEWLCRPDVRQGIAAVGAAGLVYELLIKPQHLAGALRTVDALDGVQFVVDHAAKPLVADGLLEPWRTGMRALAGRSNTTCKLSGLLHEANWHTWTVDDVRPYADAVVDAFGTDRVMIGSDWPVCTVAAPYETALTVYDAALPGPTSEERHALHAGTAAAVYRIPWPTPQHEHGDTRP